MTRMTEIPAPEDTLTPPPAQPSLQSSVKSKNPCQSVIQTISPGYKHTEVGMIPEEWATGRLEEYFSFISYGFTNPMPTAENGIYLITAADISNGEIQYDTARHTTEVAYRTLLTPKSKPKRDDILLTKDGSLGRLALVGSKEPRPKGGAFGKP